MNIGQKIRKIRLFRKMTQKDLCDHVSINTTTPQTRISQYERGYRLPKKEVINNIADTLLCSPRALSNASECSAEDFMEILFWMEEEHPGCIQFTNTSLSHSSSSSDITINFQNCKIADYIHEWYLMKSMLMNDKITDAEYFNWKITWNGAKK